jgi:type IV pilus assembly protein PilW
MKKSRPPLRSNTTVTETGFTLLELLIALLIGSIVIAVVGGLFLANTNTFRSVDDASRLQENGRFALQTVSRITRQAGFIPLDVTQLVVAANDAYTQDLGGVVGARFIAGKDGAGTSPDTSDELFIAFRGTVGGEIVDCSGTPRSATPVTLGTKPTALTLPVVNRFYVKAAKADPAAGFSLWCDVTVGGVTVLDGGYELISGVESFQILYAVDDVKTIPASAGVPEKKVRDFAPDYFTSANKLVATGDKFNAVLGVQVALVLRGAERSTIDKERTSAKLNLFSPLYDGTVNSDPGATYTISTNDKLRTFRVITSTINLRNRAA